MTTNAAEKDRPLERLRDAAVQGRAATADDLDWVLFRSFPGCEIAVGALAELAPAYVEAVRSGTPFDRELLFVRLLEAGDALPDAFRRDVARAAADRLLEGVDDPDDDIPVLRYVLRTSPDAEDLVGRLILDPALDAFRFTLTLDFALDERELDDYLAVSYLRDGDPDSGPMLKPYPVPEGLRRELALWFGGPALCARLESGWLRHTDAAERDSLRRGLEEKLPMLELDPGPTRSTP